MVGLSWNSSSYLRVCVFVAVHLNYYSQAKQRGLRDLVLFEHLTQIRRSFILESEQIITTERIYQMRAEVKTNKLNLGANIFLQLSES